MYELYIYDIQYLYIELITLYEYIIQFCILHVLIYNIYNIYIYVYYIIV